MAEAMLSRELAKTAHKDAVEAVALLELLREFPCGGWEGIKPLHADWCYSLLSIVNANLDRIEELEAPDGVVFRMVAAKEVLGHLEELFSKTDCEERLCGAADGVVAAVDSCLRDLRGLVKDIEAATPPALTAA